MSEKNESKVILKIEVTEDGQHLEHHINGLIEKAVAINALNTEIAKLSKNDDSVSKAILSGLISDCGISKDDFDDVKRTTEIASKISKTIIEAIKNSNKSSDQND